MGALWESVSSFLSLEMRGTEFSLSASFVHSMWSPAVCRVWEGLLGSIPWMTTYVSWLQEREGQWGVG